MNSIDDRPPSQTIAIVGAGASGTLLAAQLLRRAEPGTHILLVDRSGAFGPGVAYSSTSDAHRLNVAAAQMAPLPKDPEAFFRWSRAREGATRPYDYLPRRLFGEYLVDLLDDCERRAAGVVTLERCADEVVALPGAPDRSARRRLILRSGRRVDVDRVVLALGNSSPAAPPAVPPEIVASPYFVADPWAAEALGTSRSDQTVLLLGTGLTMVDVALELGVSGGPVIYAISRSGLLPRAHQRRPTPARQLPVDASGPPNLDRLVAVLTSEVIAADGRGEDWRSVIDSLRPMSNEVWAALDTEERARFQQEYARIWSIHRHRMAPQVGAAVDRLIEKGRLRVQPATLHAARIRAGAVDVDLIGVRDKATVRFRVDRIINCTGPLHDPGRIAAPLVRDLVRRGSARSNSLGVGFDTDADGTILDRDGHAVRGIYAIGPLRDGGLFETTAIPEIGQQARALATEITGNLSLRPRRQTRPTIRA
ncbi:MAG TPA: FAD/NAD(P)-binding protein [Solirubrobacterales bacterium]|jgi:uncharacterized NAD(P)/FAD-binding protein YdhS|nr:FAD/NAD(P)-binding protein [Solirubrobacterales bacterium]